MLSPNFTAGSDLLKSRTDLDVAMQCRPRRAQTVLMLHLGNCVAGRVPAVPGDTRELCHGQEDFVSNFT